ncbi:MetQ/NlpA family ABC transporter substrate-binding protein [Microbacterium sp. SLBN-146]|uniref:MetQ/NlpA family ABC transporter substrate-binding protein n=1 Tax=Microbacterium sp. SLBN-146 TaxID=2768457 RepID=UPI001153800A|nr:MetQ/NlpA family ABC transporter substrate-binding protein [Microbacterium sp. SLBN-146]TQJ31084.1 D-methionine transport system substrate-binding protein [Microbacterium sp. SLBN-146]
MKTTRTALLVAGAAALALTLSACGGGSTATPDANSSDAAEKTAISIGFNPGPYLEMFQDGILPILEEDGYTVETVDFTDGIVVNVAVSTGEIDANIMQHPVYLDFVNQQEGITNAPLVQIPTPRMGLFGGKQTSLDDVPEGATVTVPNSPSNLYRGLLILRDVGWIDFDDVDDPNTADLSIITDNPKNLNITPIENAQQVPALQDVDYATIQGNFIIAGGLDYDDALAVEDQPIEFSNVVTVREADLESPWALAIKAAYESPEFIEYITSNPQYDGYNLPAWFE